MASKKAMMIGVFCFILLVTTFSSAYICVDSDDNPAVTEFKTKINSLALKEEIKNGVDYDTFQIKHKYFIPCK